LAALEEPERSRFEADYAARVAAAYRPRSDGKTLFPFRRMFLVATAG
jgi:trans-aconitate 2-methyltransferase